jgi:hypothetical protein
MYEKTLVFSQSSFHNCYTSHFMSEYNVNNISEDILSVQIKYEVLRGSLSPKLIKNLTRIFFVLLILRILELPDFLILVHWLLRYSCFCRNIQIWLAGLHQGIKSRINGLRQWRHANLLFLTIDSTHIQWGSRCARARDDFGALFTSIYPTMRPTIA